MDADETEVIDRRGNPIPRGPGGVPAARLDEFAYLEPDQPMVFFRDGWDFRWMTGAQVLARIGFGEAAPTIVDERGDFEEPLELSQFLGELGALIEGRECAPASVPSIGDLAVELRKGMRKRRRPSVVLPTLDRDDRHFVLRLGLELGAAFIVPPDPSTFVWTVCSTRPTLVAASDGLLSQLVADLETRSRWRRRRTMSATRNVLALGEIIDERDALRAMESLIPQKATMRRVLFAAPQSELGSA